MQTTTPQFELGINAILHMLILFTALTFLFLFIVSKTETKALQGEFDNALTTNLNKALTAANLDSDGKLKVALSVATPSLKVLIKTIEGPSEATEVYNDGLFRGAYLVIGIFFSILLTMLLVMAYAANTPVMKVFLYILLSNVVLFAVVGIVEYNFFKLVATKYIPVKPSLITESIIKDIKGEFK